MIAYGCCAGSSGKFDTGLAPSLREHCPGAPVIVRRDQKSICDAYNSIMDEAAALEGLTGLVLVHDDVVFRDAQAEAEIVRALSGPGVGVVGVVGGRGQRELSWWKSTALFGHVEHATHLDDYSRGTAEVDVVDGLLMAVSPWVVHHVRLDGRGYPAFHGYDGELCRLVKEKGRKVLVADIEIFHDCKPGPWGRPEYGQALVEWQRRWGAKSKRDRAVLRAKREVLALAARHPELSRLIPASGPGRHR